MSLRGLSEGAGVARAIGQMLDGREEVRSPDQVLQLCELVVQLEGALDQLVTPAPLPKWSADSGPVVVVIARDRGVCVRLGQTPCGKEFQAFAVDFPVLGRNLFERGVPSAVVLDLHAGGAIERGLLLLDEFTQQVPPVPVLALVHHDALSLRVEIARHGARMVLPIDSPPQELSEAISGLLKQSRASASMVLAVDEDLASLATMGRLLEAQGLAVTTLEDPSRFWEVLQVGMPDLVVLSADMKTLSGHELCRGIRDDPFWRTIPVIMLTADRDGPAIERIYSAGADDFVAKPLVEAELLGRVTNRLEQFYLQQQQAGTDVLTGVTTCAVADSHIQRLLRMAVRNRHPLSLGILDFDGLHRINQEQGIEAGDAMLRCLGQSLTKSLRAEDVVARLGGDEFVVVLYNARKHDAVARLQMVLDASTYEPYPGGSKTSLAVRVSGAVVQYPQEGNDLQGLYTAAGALLAEVKLAGGGAMQTAESASPDALNDQEYDVAIVEEDEGVVALLRRAMAPYGLRSIWIGDGQIAVEQLTGVAPTVKAKVVVLEVDLPGLDGMAVLRRFAEARILSRTKVIMLTHRSNEDEVVDAFEAGAFDYVTKPFSLRVVSQRIRRALEVLNP